MFGPLSSRARPRSAISGTSQVAESLCGDGVGNDSGVFTNTIAESGLAFAQEVQTDEMKPLYHRAGTVALQRETLVMLFESEGYRVHATDSAETALELLTKIRPDLIVTDVKLTGMDGLSLFEKVRLDPASGRIPFIFMTAYNDAGTIEKVKGFGQVEYITKPFDLEDLLRLVRERSFPA